VTGDVFASLCHFIVWSVVLVCLERSANKASKPKSIVNPTHENRNENNIDQDVLKEESRIENGA